MIAKCLNPRCYNLYKAEKIGETPCPRCGSKQAVDGDAKAALIRRQMRRQEGRKR